MVKRGRLDWQRLRMSAPLLVAIAATPCIHGQQAKPSASEGEVIFQQQCAKCHGDRGQGRSALVSIAGPNLQAEHDTGKVLTAIYTGPSHMPIFSYLLSVPQANAVAKYVTQSLAVIPLTGGNLSEGGELFRVYCASCHRTAVRGGPLAFTGVNAPQLTNKSRALIAGAIRWGPGPMPKFPPAVLSDEQVASVADYVSYMQHPPNPGGRPLHFIGPVAEGLAAWVFLFLVLGGTMWIEKGGEG